MKSIQFLFFVLFNIFCIQARCEQTGIQIIDHGDSVVFDLSQAVINGNVIDIPVSILSDDTVFALDFSFKFNHSKLTFDTILNNAPYISSVYYYNSADSTLRFTSNSFHQYAVDSPLVIIRFNMINGLMTGTDLFEMLSYLNGDTCSAKYIDILPTSVNEKFVNVDLFIYPNPSNGIVNIKGKVSKIIMLDLMSRQLAIFNSDDFISQIDLTGYRAGLYYLKFCEGEKVEKVFKIQIL